MKGSVAVTPVTQGTGVSSNVLEMVFVMVPTATVQA